MTIEFNFIDEFYKKVEELKIDWSIKGLLAKDLKVYALGNDSKLLGRVFEILAAPIVNKIAEEHDLILKIPDKQNTYPDFTLMKSENSTEKIGIDIKTTYKQNRMGFTLGSFTSYLRDNTKNIHYPFDHYKEHYIIGFIYTRNLEAEEGHITTVDNLISLDAPYQDVEFFVRKKIDITGQKKGSGNTDNIGSIQCHSAADFKIKNGAFAHLPESLYLHYWRNYPRNIDREKIYIDLDSYFQWLEVNQNSIPDAEELLSYKPVYDEWVRTNNF